MESTKFGTQVVKFVKRADKLVADVLKGVGDLQQAAKELKQVWKGDEEDDEKRD